MEALRIPVFCKDWDTFVPAIKSAPAVAVRKFKGDRLSFAIIATVVGL